MTAEPDVPKAASPSWPALDLPIKPPFEPMLAKLVRELPEGEGWQFEPKWDGFRALCFRDGDALAIQSRAGQPLARYFPEMVEALLALAPRKFVLDAEIVIPTDGTFSFDDLLMRIHPAESRVKKLAAETPGQLFVFDLLVDESGENLIPLPCKERRKRLEAFAKRFPDGGRIKLCQATEDRATLDGFEAELRGKGIDGLMAKRTDAEYRPGDRSAMQKFKWMRTADCVVGGFRYASTENIVGSLLLGLYDEKGVLQHVGFSSNMKKGDRKALTPKLEGMKGAGFSGRAPGGPSRWATERTGDWTPLEPKLVCEVQYDHFSQGRFRHGCKFLRWREDKRPDQCTFDQLIVEKKTDTKSGR